jgi:hypothetical protein
MAGYFNQTIRSYGGLSLEYEDISESDFAAANGAAYTPPERGTESRGIRRINVARAIQILAECPGVIETFQSADAELRLPANTVLEATNDAGNGRLFFVKNSGTANARLLIKDYLGNLLFTLYMNTTVIVVGNMNNTWDFYMGSSGTFPSVTGEPTGFVNTMYDSVVSFNETSLQFSISPVSGSFKYLIQGVEYVKTGTDTVNITNNDGVWYFYYVGTVLTASQTPWTIGDTTKAFIQAIYWNTQDQKATVINEERHGLVMDWATHRYNHFVQGLIPEEFKFDASNYILRGDGSLNTHAQIGVTNIGRVFDEDLDILPVNSTTPTQPYEQILSPYLNAPVLYRSGASGFWRKLAATAYPLAWQAGNLARYNQWTGATWQLTTCTDNYFVNSYVCIVEDPRHPLIVFLGQNQFPTVVDAANELFKNLVTAFPMTEVYPLFKLIYKTSTTYTNQPKSVLYAILPVGETVVDNDRYTYECGYNGNAGVGKYMDRSTGTSTSEDPFTLPEASFIRYITVQTSADSTGTIALYKMTDLVNPLLSMSITAIRYAKFSFSQYFAADEQFALKVTSGSFAKPLVTIWIQTQLG